MKKTNMMARRRVQFIFPNQTIEKLDQLKEQVGASSRTEVLKTAVELLSWAMSHLARGEEIARGTRWQNIGDHRYSWRSFPLHE